jgi:L-threonylcarbamoyladenylate synthase
MLRLRSAQAPGNIGSSEFILSEAEGLTMTCFFIYKIRYSTYIMRILPFSDASLQEAIALLRAGEVIAHATETCYGFACDLANMEAVKTLFAIKKRDHSQPVSALFATADDAKQYVMWNERAEELAAKHLPGPLTLILQLRSDVPRPVFSCPSPGATLGIRVSSHSQAQQLVETFGGPLSTTSANLHGQPSPYSAQEILEQFKNEAVQPALILDSGVLPKNPPSTVVDLTQENPTQLRRGELQF